MLNLQNPAQAFDLFGIHLWGEKSGGPVSPDARPYEVVFAVTGPGAGLADTFKNASELWTRREEAPPASAAVLVARARGDYPRLLAALRNEGYYAVSIAISVDGQRAEQLTPDADVAKPAKVNVAISTGPLFHFGRVEIINPPPPKAPRLGSKPIATAENLGLTSGQPAKIGTILVVKMALAAGWRQNGWPLARVLEPDIAADYPDARVDVRLQAEPGPAAVLGPMEVKGATHMDPAFVREMTGLKEGEPYDSDRISAAEKRLRDLNVFSSARINEGTSLQGGALPLSLQLAERPLHVVGASGFYSTLDGVELGGYWQHRNLFGHAESLRLEARISGINSARPGDYSYSTGATFTRPGIWGPETSLIARVGAAREVHETYRQNSAFTSLGLSRAFSDRLTATAALAFEATHADDAYGRRDLMFASVPMDLTYDGRDDVMEPTSGYRLKGALEPFYETRLGTKGAISRVDASAYWPVIGSDRLVLAGRLALGSIVGASADHLPPSRLFFAGGGQSVRGFAYRSLGPTVASGRIGGGTALFEGSLELRARVTDTIGVVPFVDVGSAYSSAYPDFSAPLNVGAGLGLRYYTGLGAIRVDAATPVTKDPNGNKFSLYIGLGESF